MQIIETVKAHPYLTAGGVFVVGAILIYALSGSAPAAPAAAVITSQSPVSDNSAATVANMAYGVQARGIEAGLSASLAATGAALEASKSRDAVDLANIYAASDTTKFVASLDADVENRRTAGTVSIANTNATAAVAITALNNDALRAMSLDAKEVAFAGFDRDRFAISAAQTLGLAAQETERQRAAREAESTALALTLANQLGNAQEFTKREAQQFAFQSGAYAATPIATAPITTPDWSSYAAPQLGQ